MGHAGIYFVSYYADNKTRPQIGANNYIENFNVASNSISFDIKSLEFYTRNVKVVVYYAVKVTKDISSVVGGSDVEFTNNCSATVVRTDGSTKTKDDSAKVTVTGPNITKLQETMIMTPTVLNILCISMRRVRLLAIQDP